MTQGLFRNLLVRHRQEIGQRFEHYHSSFYKHVEALSVTPFAPRALDRGLSALLVALIREQELSMNPNAAAQGLDRTSALVAEVVAAIASRAGEVVEQQHRAAAPAEELLEREELAAVAKRIPGQEPQLRQRVEDEARGLEPLDIREDGSGRFRKLDLRGMEHRVLLGGLQALATRRGSRT